MAETKIEWADKVWNPIVGCSPISPGCVNCYAMRDAARKASNPATPQYHEVAAFDNRHKPRWTGKLRLVEHKLDEPLRWRKPARIFVNSMSDLFHERVPNMWIQALFGVMSWCSHHTFIILTKRAERMSQWFIDNMVPACQAEMTIRAVEIGSPVRRIPRGVTDNINHHNWPLPNVWLGVSVEDQQRADERIPHLLATPAAVRFVSAEPLIGPVSLESLPSVSGHGRHLNALSNAGCYGADVQSKLDWVIVGGESGPGARLMSAERAQSVRDQCVEAKVPFFFKQWGEYLPPHQDGAPGDGQVLNASDVFVRVGKARAGHLLDGREWNEFPETRHG